MNTPSELHTVNELTSFSVLSYGVVINIYCSASVSSDIIKLAERAFPNNFAIHETADTSDHSFVIQEVNADSFRLLRDQDAPIQGLNKHTTFELFVRMIRLMVSEGAKEHVFLHAGVVALGNKTLILPGHSGSGKTSLVIELLKLGAVYYSDEYAVLDKDGEVHPFARDLSVRSEKRNWNEKDGMPAVSYGGVSGTQSLPAGMVLFTEFSIKGDLNFERVSLGQGILAAIPHTITFPKRPDFSLKLLNCAFSRAIILTGLRCESDITAKHITSLL